MLIKKEDAKKFTIPGGTEGWLYPSIEEADMSIALVEMDGIYPEEGVSINDTSKETIFLIKGGLEVDIEGKKYNLEDGDFVTILPNQKYSIKGKGKVLDVIAPSWEKNNNKIIAE